MSAKVKFESGPASTILSDMKTQYENMESLLSKIESNASGNYYNVKGHTASEALEIINSMKKIEKIVGVVKRVNDNLESLNESYNEVLDDIEKVVAEQEGKV